LSNMLANTKLTGKQLFDLIMLETKEVIDRKIRISDIALVAKEVLGINIKVDL